MQPSPDSNATSSPLTILPLVLDNISLVVKKEILLKNISATISAQTRTVIMGPNGAGKSLLMRVCHGLVKPSKGEIRWQQKADAANLQAMVFQRPVLLRRSVADNINFALAAIKLPRKQRKAEIDNALQRAGLGEFAHRPARVLSGGEQQRLALIRAWVIRPQVLFLDEPTANLDPGATQIVEQLINTIHAEGTKIIMSTHDFGQAKRVSDEIIFLHRGKLLVQCDTRTFFSKPQNDAAQAFIDGKNYW